MSREEVEGALRHRSAVLMVRTLQREARLLLDGNVLLLGAVRDAAATLEGVNAAKARELRALASTVESQSRALRDIAEQGVASRSHS
jgi:hypothetical protein